MVGVRVLRYLTYLPLFLPNSWGVAANGAAVIEFNVHVVIVGSLWLGYEWTIWLVELGY